MKKSIYVFWMILLLSQDLYANPCQTVLGTMISDAIKEINEEQNEEKKIDKIISLWSNPIKKQSHFSELVEILKSLAFNAQNSVIREMALQTLFYDPFVRVELFHHIAHFMDQNSKGEENCLVRFMDEGCESSYHEFMQTIWPYLFGSTRVHFLNEISEKYGFDHPGFLKILEQYGQKEPRQTAYSLYGSILAQKKEPVIINLCNYSVDLGGDSNQTKKVFISPNCRLFQYNPFVKKLLLDPNHIKVFFQENGLDYEKIALFFEPHFLKTGIKLQAILIKYMSYQKKGIELIKTLLDGMNTEAFPPQTENEFIEDLYQKESKENPLANLKDFNKFILGFSNKEKISDKFIKDKLGMSRTALIETLCDCLKKDHPVFRSLSKKRINTYDEAYFLKALLGAILPKEITEENLEDVIQILIKLSTSNNIAIEVNALCKDYKIGIPANILVKAVNMMRNLEGLESESECKRCKSKSLEIESKTSLKKAIAHVFSACNLPFDQDLMQESLKNRIHQEMLQHKLFALDQIVWDVLGETINDDLLSENRQYIESVLGDIIGLSPYWKNPYFNKEHFTSPEITNIGKQNLLNKFTKLFNVQFIIYQIKEDIDDCVYSCNREKIIEMICDHARLQCASFNISDAWIKHDAFDLHSEDDNNETYSDGHWPVWSKILCLYLLNINILQEGHITNEWFQMNERGEVTITTQDDAD